MEVIIPLQSEYFRSYLAAAIGFGLLIQDTDHREWVEDIGMARAGAGCGIRHWRSDLGLGDLTAVSCTCGEVIKGIEPGSSGGW